MRYWTGAVIAFLLAIVQASSVERAIPACPERRPEITSISAWFRAPESGSSSSISGVENRRRTRGF